MSLATSPVAEAAPLQALAGRDLEALRGTVNGHLAAEGCTFGARAPFVVDPVPRVLAGAEWDALAAGLEQRVYALDALLADAAGPRAAVRDGVVPARVLDAVAAGEDLRPVAGRARLALVGLDVLRGPDGAFVVLEDNARTPSGLAYALAARRALAAALGPQALHGVRDATAGVADTLRAALLAAAPENVAEPALAVLTDGAAGATYWEHGELARLLQAPLVTPAQLQSRRGALVRRDAEGRARSVDVLYRRCDDDRLLDDRGRPTALGALLDEPLRAGTLGCANACGSGLADDKLVHAYVDDLVRYFCGAEPLVRSVPTYDLERPEQREEALDRLDELVVKPRGGLGGDGVVLCAGAAPEILERCARDIREHPERFVAQRTVAFSRHPTVVDGVLEDRHVDLRPYVCFDGGRATTLPAALTRVALGRGDMVVNASRDGGTKDTWVLA